MPPGLLRLGTVCEVEASGAGRTLSLLFGNSSPSAESMQRHFTSLKLVQRALTRRGKHVAKIIADTRALDALRRGLRYGGTTEMKRVR